MLLEKMSTNTLPPQSDDEERQVAGKPIVAAEAVANRSVPESRPAKRRAGIQGRKGLFLIPD